MRHAHHRLHAASGGMCHRLCRRLWFLIKRGSTMRFLTFRDAEGTHLGLLQGEQIMAVRELMGEGARAEPDGMLGLIEAGTAALERIQKLLSKGGELPTVPQDAVEILAPIP